MMDVIEDGMIARVKAASDADELGYRFRTLATYGGELDDTVLREIVRQLPAGWVVYAGERLIDMGDGRFDSAPRFSFMVAAESARNESASRRGDGTNPGAYQLVKDVKALLAWQTLGLDIEPLVPREVRTLFNGRTRDDQVAIFAIEFTTLYGNTFVHDAPIDDFTNFHADWDVPAFGDHDSVPLDPADADATDDVTLEGPGGS